MARRENFQKQFPETMKQLKLGNKSYMKMFKNPWDDSDCPLALSGASEVAES